ncbi:hypothetical protein ACXITP_02300 [Actinotignum sanguinis]|uniref:DUF732 domain-containing protein n=2 Tax=Actinomycetaceae TaxID=2049 RepID=A0ABZ0REA1_9ACTO|nr:MULTISPECIES: hypothetical protein [Actinotignum]WPJ89708.1 hypothetical protein R0V15_03710 [Schaalia turicensis]MDE1552129.1 hypothetical protein [Actinotignum sanguinis]MDE1565254.1 hypothetical protein [Actinotignum sanguinis]MDE1577415.1 hypothetical protein [Actinotignum sanguinis]MDE1642267.1 hypothetical protein [Actinotignum sanguinis]
MRKFLGGVAAVCLVVNLAACSGKSDTSESATPAPETSVAASAPAAPSAPVESSAEPAAPITDKGPAAIATDGPAPSRDEVSAGMLAATSELLKNTQDIPEAQKAMLPQLVECTVDEALNRGLSEQGQRNIAAQVLLLSQEDQAIMGEAAKVCGEKFGAN